MVMTKHFHFEINSYDNIVIKTSRTQTIFYMLSPLPPMLKKQKTIFQYFIAQ